jgi:acetyl esterase/lipase
MKDADAGVKEGQSRSSHPEPALLDLPYLTGASPRQALDLYLPDHACAPVPAVLWIHGGAWECGNRHPCPVQHLTARGYAVASIGYRLSDEAAFPAQLQDCKSAVRWLHAHAAEYGIDPARLGVWGESAGGHLAALLGTTGRMRDFDVADHLEQSSAVQCVVDWFGPVDFLDWGVPFSPSMDSPESAVYRLFGGPISQHQEMARRASPLQYVEGQSAPFFIIHGDRDDIVPLIQSERLHQALQAAGAASTLRIIPGAGHSTAEFSLPERLDEIADFLARHLMQPGNSVSKEAHP